MTRVARLNEAMWTELFLENRDFLAEKIEELIGHLTAYSAAIRKHDREALKNLLQEGRLRKEFIESGGTTWKK